MPRACPSLAMETRKGSCSTSVTDTANRNRRFRGIDNHVRGQTRDMRKCNADQALANRERVCAEQPNVRRRRNPSVSEQSCFENESALGAVGLAARKPIKKNPAGSGVRGRSRSLLPGLRIFLLIVLVPLLLRSITCVAAEPRMLHVTFHGVLFVFTGLRQIRILTL
jgi:hypothetical protein